MIVAPHSPTVSETVRVFPPTVSAHSPTVSDTVGVFPPTVSAHSALQRLVIKHTATSRRVASTLPAPLNIERNMLPQ
ncbi:hypothetical protein HETIRDRAFT_223969, partial [Heterobasidion irregulare TC 32-1]